MHAPNTFEDFLFMAMGAVIPLLINVVQALLRAAERKANSLARQSKDSDRPKEERRSREVKELGQTWSGKVLTEAQLRKMMDKAHKENGHD